MVELRETRFPTSHELEWLKQKAVTAQTKLKVAPPTLEQLTRGATLARFGLSTEADLSEWCERARSPS